MGWWGGGQVRQVLEGREKGEFGCRGTVKRRSYR